MTNTAHVFPRVALLLCPLLALCAPGCREHSGVKEPWEVQDPVREQVEGLRHRLDAPLKQAAEARGGASAMKALLAKEAKRPWRARVSDGIKYADLFLKLYEERQWHKVAVTANGLSEAGAQALARVEGYKTHAISEPKSYHVAHIKAGLKAHAARTPVPWTPVVLDGRQVNTLVRWAKAQGLTGQDPHALEGAVLKALLSQTPGQSPLPQLTQALATYTQATKGQAEELASLELHLMDGALRYARDMRLFNLRRYDWNELKAGGGSKAIIYKRLGDFFGQLSSATDPAQVAAALDALTPRTPSTSRCGPFATTTPASWPPAGGRA